MKTFSVTSNHSKAPSLSRGVQIRRQASISRRVHAVSTPLHELFGETMFGPVAKENQVTLYEQMSEDGTAVRLWSPLVDREAPIEEIRKLPVMFYLPGFDGTGLGIARQFTRLMQSFNFVAFTVPLDNQNSFTELVSISIQYISDYLECTDKERPVYLLGESFGALLTFAIADAMPDVIDRVVLVNPATSYKQSIWAVVGPLIQQIPNELYGALAFALLPLFGNPVAMAAYHIDLSKPLPEILDGAITGMRSVFGSAGFIGDVFTQDRLDRRLKLVQNGVEFTALLISKIPQRTLLITAEGDWALPSNDESKRLPSMMRRCRSRSFGFRSHALLQEAGIDLPQILKDEGFYVTQRQFSTENGRNQKLNSFGQPLPVELPTEIEVQNLPYLKPVMQLVSPVFYSSTPDSNIVQGLSAFPEDRPLIIVGNHQLLGIDAVVLIEGLIRQKRVLIRGLTHPIVFSNMRRDESEKGSDGQAGNQSVEDFVSTYGAVKISPSNLHRLLSQGESVLLYPGGTRESNRLRNEQYKVFWPERAEFVRMGAKFEATIVTVASIGFEEMFEIVMDSKELMQVPVINEWVRQNNDRAPKARFWTDSDIEDTIIPPLVRPSLPQRQYFLFGKPFRTTIEHYNDRELGQQLYEEIKQDLELNIEYLLRRSKDDPYGDFFQRFIYERTNGGKQAPSFEP